jgi:hypothetical protein
MVRRITIDEAAADFKAIVEAALENGDCLEFERNGRVVGRVGTPPSPPALPESKVPLGEFLRKIAEDWPDEDFAKDLEEAMRYSRSDVLRDKWES